MFIRKTLTLLYIFISFCGFSQNHQSAILNINLLNEFSHGVNLTENILVADQKMAFSEYTSFPMPAPLTDADPFLTIAIKHALEAAKAERIFIGLSNNENAVEKWIEAKADHHSNHENHQTVSELIFIEKGYQYLTLHIIFKEKIAYENIEVHFFNPDKTPEINKNLPIENQSEACPCPQPTFQNRLGWCPAGNCPPHPNPTSTNPTHLIIHHSAGTNISSDWAAIVRSIWNFHVNTNGWSDIGYNWLVDPNGVLYEGRGDNILGAHFCGTNGGTVGVCVMGDFTNVAPTSAATGKLEDLFAWKACDINADPLAQSFHGGSQQQLYNVSGHRDGCATSCPGDMFYPMLPTIRQNIKTKIDNCQSSTVLAAPTNLDGSALSATEITLNWVDNSPDEDAFIIERSASFNTNYAVVGSVGADVTTYNDNGLTPNTGYFYKIRAANAVDTSDYSNEKFIPTPQTSNTQNMGKNVSIQVFPNPVQDIVNIEIESEYTGDLNIEILDISGKQVLFKQQFTKSSMSFHTALQVNALSKGVYILKIMQGDESWLRKLVK